MSTFDYFKALRQISNGCIIKLTRYEDEIEYSSEDEGLDLIQDECDNAQCHHIYQEGSKDIEDTLCNKVKKTWMSTFIPDKEDLQNKNNILDRCRKKLPKRVSRNLKKFPLWHIAKNSGKYGRGQTRVFPIAGEYYKISQRNSLKIRISKYIDTITLPEHSELDISTNIINEKQVNYQNITVSKQLVELIGDADSAYGDNASIKMNKSDKSSPLPNLDAPEIEEVVNQIPTFKKDLLNKSTEQEPTSIRMKKNNVILLKSNDNVPGELLIKLSKDQSNINANKDCGKALNIKSSKKLLKGQSNLQINEDNDLCNKGIPLTNVRIPEQPQIEQIITTLSEGQLNQKMNKDNNLASKSPPLPNADVLEQPLSVNQDHCTSQLSHIEVPEQPISVNEDLSTPISPNVDVPQKLSVKRNIKNTSESVLLTDNGNKPTPSAGSFSAGEFEVQWQLSESKVGKIWVKNFSSLTDLENASNKTSIKKKTWHTPYINKREALLRNSEGPVFEQVPKIPNNKFQTYLPKGSQVLKNKTSTIKQQSDCYAVKKEVPVIKSPKVVSNSQKNQNSVKNVLPEIDSTINKSLTILMDLCIDHRSQIPPQVETQVVQKASHIGQRNQTDPLILESRLNSNPTAADLPQTDPIPPVSQIKTPIQNISVNQRNQANLILRNSISVSSSDNTEVRALVGETEQTGLVWIYAIQLNALAAKKIAKEASLNDDFEKLKSDIMKKYCLESHPEQFLLELIKTALKHCDNIKAIPYLKTLILEIIHNVIDDNSQINNWNIVIRKLFQEHTQPSRPTQEFVITSSEVLEPKYQKKQESKCQKKQESKYQKKQENMKPITNCSKSPLPPSSSSSLVVSNILTAPYISRKMQHIKQLESGNPTTYKYLGIQQPSNYALQPNTLTRNMQKLPQPQSINTPIYKESRIQQCLNYYSPPQSIQKYPLQPQSTQGRPNIDNVQWPYGTQRQPTLIEQQLQKYQFQQNQLHHQGYQQQYIPHSSPLLYTQQPFLTVSQQLSQDPNYSTKTMQNQNAVLPPLLSHQPHQLTRGSPPFANSSPGFTGLSSNHLLPSHIYNNSVCYGSAQQNTTSMPFNISNSNYNKQCAIRSTNNMAYGNIATKETHNMSSSTRNLYQFGNQVPSCNAKQDQSIQSQSSLQPSSSSMQYQSSSPENNLFKEPCEEMLEEFFQCTGLNKSDIDYITGHH